MSEPFDFLVIGGGPAGEKAATKAAYLGARTALIERERDLGGRCFAGGLPSKVLRDAALSYSGARRRIGDLFRQSPSHRMPMEWFTKATSSLCASHAQRASSSLSRHGVEVVGGDATLVSASDVDVSLFDGTTRRLRAEKILIATGSRPERPSFVPFDRPGIYDSTSLLTMTALPEAMIVIGGGVIGAEYASIFAALDVDVTLIDLGDRLLPFLDHELSERLVASLKRRGVRIELGCSATSVESSEGGHCVSLGGREPARGDVVLFSGGRIANTEALGLEAIGVDIGRKGRPVVSDCGQTSVPSIYAAGDVIGFPALASTSAEQGRVAAAHALLDGRDVPADRPDVIALDDSRPHSLLPLGIYTIPSVSCVGLSEAEAIRAGHDVVVGRASYGDRDRGRLLGDTSGMLKLVCERSSHRILGVHIVGELAEELIHTGQACMHFGATAGYFVRSVVNFPTLTSLYKSAAYDLLTRINPESARFAYSRD